MASRRRKINAQRSNTWLICGILAMLAVAISSFFMNIADGAQPRVVDLIDWLAASVIYFFLGALLGHAIDRVIAWRRKQAIDTPLFVRLMAFLWIIGAVAAEALASSPDLTHRILFLFFPVVYGIFFTPFAWDALLPTVNATLYGRLALNLAFLAAFVAWVTLTVRTAGETHARNVVRRLLLLALFIVLLIGTVSCAAHL